MKKRYFLIEHISEKGGGYNPSYILICNNSKKIIQAWFEKKHPRRLLSRIMKIDKQLEIL